MVGDLKGIVVILLVVLAMLCMPALGQKTAVDWYNKGIALEAHGNYDEALQAYDKAMEIDPHDQIAWNNKVNALNKLGRTTEANTAYAKFKELEATDTFTILDHSMASDVDESTKSVINRTQKFSVNNSKAYSWLSLRNVPGAGTVWWYWYSPAGDMLHTDKVQIPMPTSGERWSTYNVLSHIDILGNDAANLSGKWHVDVYLDGNKILTEDFSIFGGQPPISPENQYLYNSSEYDKATNENLYNHGKHETAMREGGALYNQGRYDEAIDVYDEAINLSPDDFQNWKAWNGKGESLYKKGKYEAAIQAYDRAIQIIPDNSMVWANKGNALKALGRTNESNVAYATAKELGFGNSTWMAGNNATGINLTRLYFIQILDQCMASNVDESTNNVITRSNTFSGTDRKVYSWLSLGHVLGATVEWHWYSPDGNSYKTGQVDISRNRSGGFWPSYNVWYRLDIADIPNEPYLSGNWHVDIYINGQKRQTEQFIMKIGSGTTAINPNATSNPSAAPGPSATHGTITVLDHCMASKIDEPTKNPVTTTKTNEFKDNVMANSWLRLGNVGVARVEWDWHNGGGLDIKDTYNIPPNPNGGYYSSYNIWDPLDIPNLVSLFKGGEADASDARERAEEANLLPTGTNNVADPYGDWTVDVYVNDQWLLQEQFTVVSG